MADRCYDLTTKLGSFLDRHMSLPLLDGRITDNSLPALGFACVAKLPAFVSMGKYGKSEAKDSRCD